jgi:hypothetical protein
MTTEPKPRPDTAGLHSRTMAEFDRLLAVASRRAAEVRAAGVGRGSASTGNPCRDADLAGDAEAVEIAEIEARFAVHPLGQNPRSGTGRGAT